MPVMETDVEESDYLGKRWESAVEAIISAINDTTAVDSTTLSELDATNITAV